MGGFSGDADGGGSVLRLEGLVVVAELVAVLAAWVADGGLLYLSLNSLAEHLMLSQGMQTTGIKVLQQRILSEQLSHRPCPSCSMMSQDQAPPPPLLLQRP